MRKRAQYQQNIWEYKRRRELARKKYSQALKSMRGFTTKINVWQKAMNRIDERNKKMQKLVAQTNYYFNVNIRSKKLDDEHKLARQVYFKTGMENKIMGRFLAEFIGKNGRTAFRNRVSLTRSFKTKPQNREAFYNFKKYIS